MDEIEKIAITQLVFPIVKDLIVPKLRATYQKYFSTENVEDYQLNFENYLSVRYTKFLIIDTLAFPNKQTFFHALYEPLTIIRQGNDEIITVKIDSFPQKLLEKHFRIIIEDTAGMGKSTIIKKLFLSIVEEKLYIPFLIELRQLSEHNTVLDELKRQLSYTNLLINKEFVTKLLEEGGFVFLLDGYDEIPQKDKHFVINELKSFIENTAENFFVITSRKEDSLVTFGDFQKFHVKPLSINEAFSLIKRYDTYSHHPFGDDLIEQLQKTEQATLKEYLENPFLVSLIFKSYEFKKDIPLKKSQFYRQVFDALFEAHDLSKEGYYKREKYSALHLDDFERVLRVIGYLTAIENKVEYEKDYILNIVNTAKKILFDLDFKSTDFLKDLLETVPLFKKDGNYYKWSHKSLQDYFAAKFIWIDAREDTKDILDKIFNTKDNKRFYNILDIYHEIDPIGFEKNIVLKLSEEAVAYNNATYNHFDQFSIEDLEYRKQGHFNKTCSIVSVFEKDLHKDGDVNDSAFDKYSAQLKHRWSQAYLQGINGKQNLLIFFDYVYNIDTILQIVHEKYPHLVSSNTQMDLNKADFKALSKLERGTIYSVSDDIENKLNTKELFSIISKVLNSNFSLNLKEILKKNEILKEEFGRKSKNELLNW